MYRLRLDPESPWHPWVSLGGAALFCVLIVVGLINRSCTQSTLGVEARQVAMERCLAADYLAHRCSALIEAHHDDCIKGSIDYPGRYDSHEPFLRPDRYYVCVMLGKEGYRAWRREVYQANTNHKREPPPPFPEP
ncbi:MAG: hypothetical protein AAFS10_16705 [Myxococcota bacterium]